MKVYNILSKVSSTEPSRIRCEIKCADHHDEV